MFLLTKAAKEPLLYVGINWDLTKEEVTTEKIKEIQDIYAKKKSIIITQDRNY
jgi:hypothetical protein